MDLIQILRAENNRLLHQTCQQLGCNPRDCDLEPVTQHSNLNDVVKLRTIKGVYFIKRSPETPLGNQLSVPANRNQYEAQATALAATIAAAGIVTPRCLYLDKQHHFFVMAALATAPRMLAQRSPEDFSILQKFGPQLASWLAQYHRLSHMLERPHAQNQLLQQLLYRHVLARGITTLFPRQAEQILTACCAHQDSLVHGDLWGKNLLVTDSGDLGIVDFEGAMRGDAAGDIAALWCSALFCCMQSALAMAQWRSFCKDFQRAYCANCDFDERPFGPRIGAHMVLLLCHRVAGLFPYKLSLTHEQIITRLVQELLSTPGLHPQQVVECAYANYTDTPGIAV